MLAPLLFNIFFAAVINVPRRSFKVDKDIVDALEHTGAGGWGEVTSGEPVLATSLWGTLYPDDAGGVSQSPEQLSNMMRVIVVVCAAFGLTVSEAKTEIMCLRTKRMPDSTIIFSVEVFGQMYNQTNEFVSIGRNVNHKADLPIKVDRRIATHGVASGSTSSNCTTDGALPSSSNSGC